MCAGACCFMFSFLHLANCIWSLVSGVLLLVCYFSKLKVNQGLIEMSHEFQKIVEDFLAFTVFFSPFDFFRS